MWWWRKVRRANIPDNSRDWFERYGEVVIAQALATSYAGSDPSSLSGFVFQRRDDAANWLTERRDIHERKEDRLETVEWAILVFVVVGVMADIILVMYGLGGG